MKYYSLILEFLILILIILALSCTNNGNTRKMPMKPYRVINIPDGEYLHYSYYFGGEKSLDNYMVTKKVSNSNGDILYRIYFNSIAVSGGKKPSEDYTKWPMFFLVDPGIGCVIESETHYSTNSPGIGGLIYSHYRLFRDRGYIEYISKSIKGAETFESRYRVRVNPDYPSWDMWSGIYFSMRFMDVRTPGIIYIIIPEVIKEPIPFTAVYSGSDTVTVKAGTFKVNKSKMAMGDAFLGKLLNPMMGNATSLVTDSDRRLVVKIGAAQNANILEEISNVSIK